MLGQGFNSANLGSSPRYKSQITPESVIQQLKSSLESGSIKSNTKDPDYKKYLDQLTELAEREAKARENALVPRKKGNLEKYGIPAGIGLASLIAILSNGKGVDRAMGSAVGGLLGISGAKNRSYENKQQNALDSDLSMITDERNTLKDMYNIKANADATEYKRGQDLEANKIRMFDMMNNLERTKQAQNMPERYRTLEEKIASGQATKEEIDLWMWMKTASKGQEKTMTPGQNVSYLEKLRNAQVNDIFNRATTTAGGLDPKYGITNPINSRELLSQAANSTANYKTNPWFGQGVSQPDSSLYNLNNEMAGVDSNYLRQLQSLGSDMEAWGLSQYRERWKEIPLETKKALFNKFRDQ